MSNPHPASRRNDIDQSDLYGGVALAVAAILAVAVANSPLGSHYTALLDLTAEIRVGSIGLTENFEHWINDALMAVFFLFVGLEIKREVLVGALANVRRAALPVIAALGGFAVPVAIYVVLNWRDPEALRGWAVPAATDIAFATGICALLGRALPASLRTFLLALAIIDALLAIVVIAAFYTDHLSGASLLLAAAGIAGLAVLNRFDVRTPGLYLLLGLFIWVCVLKSGVHATLAGVAVGFCIPLTRHDGESLLDHLEHALKPWVNYGIMPIFAFANSGVILAGVSVSSLVAPIPLGIVAGLFVDKQLGVFSFAITAVSSSGLPSRPPEQPFFSSMELRY